MISSIYSFLGRETEFSLNLQIPVGHQSNADQGSSSNAGH